MSWTQKKYERINWRNRPSTATALGATNLNRMDVFLNEVDNALIEFDANKLNIETANTMIASLTIDVNTGIIIATQYDGTVFTWDLNLEKIPVSFSLSEDGILTMVTEDGTEFTANIADLIKEYVFDDSDTIGFSKTFKDEAYYVSAIVKEGSIEGKHLKPDYRADIQQYSNTAQTAANDALQYSKDSKRWAVGDAGYPGSENDNAKKYKEQAEEAKVAAEQARDEAQAATGTVIMAPGVLGVGKPDGTTITVDADGTIHGASFADIATPSKAGIVKPDDVSVKVGSDGTLSVPGSTPDFYGPYEDFPIPGNPDILYIDNTVDPRLMYTWDEESQTYIITGGSGAADGGSMDIPVLLKAMDWVGETAPYSQTITVPQMREDMTPLYVLDSSFATPENIDLVQYAFSLITGYTAAYAEMTFYAADLPDADIHLLIKGVPSQIPEFPDNSLVVVVPADGFTLNDDYGRYEQTIPVDGMHPGMGGVWDIVRSGPVLTLEESKICASITDIIRLEGAVKVVCLEPPEAQYMLVLYGTYTQATEGTILLAGMQGWFDRVDKLEDNLGDKFSTAKTYAVGDYCIYDDILYKFTTAKGTGQWDDTKVKNTTVQEEFKDQSVKMEGIANPVEVNFSKGSGIGFSVHKNNSAVMLMNVSLSPNSAVMGALEIDSATFYIFGKIDNSNPFNCSPKSWAMSLCNILFISVENSNRTIRGISAMGIYYDGVNTYVLCTSNPISQTGNIYGFIGTATALHGNYSNI